MVDFFAIKVEAGAFCSPLLDHGGKGVVNDVVEFGGGSGSPLNSSVGVWEAFGGVGVVDFDVGCFLVVVFFLLLVVCCGVCSCLGWLGVLFCGGGVEGGEDVS